MTRRYTGIILVITAMFLVLSGCSQRENPDAASLPAASMDTGNPGKTAAGRPGHGPAVRRWWTQPEITSELHLTDDQLQQIETIMSEAGKKMAAQTQHERRASTRFYRSLNQEPVNPEKVDTMQSVLEKTLADRHRLRIDQELKIRSVLTLEQWKKLWKLAPQTFQIGKVRIFMGPTLHVTDGTPVPTPTS